MLDKPDWRALAEKTLHAFDSQLERAPSAMPQMLAALDSFRSKAKQIVIAGQPDAADTKAMLREVHRHSSPTKSSSSPTGARARSSSATASNS